MAQGRSRYQKAVCAVLERLRMANPDFRDVGKFSIKAGIAQATVNLISRGQITPTLPVIERWIDACGSSLAQLFAAVLEEHDEKPTGSKVRILHAYETYYRLLTIILESKNVGYVEGILANLVGMAAAASPENAFVRKQKEIFEKQHRPPPEEENEAKKRRA
jgi:hypothetical protein